MMEPPPSGRPGRRHAPVVAARSLAALLMPMTPRVVFPLIGRLSAARLRFPMPRRAARRRRATVIWAVTFLLIAVVLPPAFCLSPAREFWAPP